MGTVDEVAADEAEPDEVAPDVDATSGRLAFLASVAAVVPILVAGIRGALTDWTPTGDDAYSAVRAWDLFTSNPPLLGTWSSASDYTGHEINHPGPLQFDLLAIPVRLLGHGAGTAIGLALVNATAVTLIAWLVHRRLGPAAAALAAGASALLSWSLGSEMLYDPWSQHAPLIPFSLFLVAVWCAVAGDTVALPVMVVAGSYALQTHLSYTVLVPVLAAFALVAVIVHLRKDRRRAIRWSLITAAVALGCWAQPLIQQYTSEDEGNLAALARSAGADAPTPGLARAVRAFGGTVAVPPMWLPPSFGSPSFHLSGAGRPTWLAATALIALTLALALLGWRAHRRGSTAVATGAWTGLAALALGFVTTLQMPIRMGMVATYARFMWPLGMVVWLTLGVAVLDEVRAHLTSATASRRLVLPGLALALTAGLATLPRVDNQTASPRWTVDAIHGIDDDVVAAVEDQGPVLVEMHAHLTVGAVGPALFVVLQDAGIPFLVDDEHLVSQLGEDRRADPGEAKVRLIVKGGREATAGPNEELIASWQPLSDDEQARLDDLSDQLRTIVADQGVPLTDDGQRILEGLGMDDMLQKLAQAKDDPDTVVKDEVLRELWSGVPALYDGHPVIDEDVFPAKLMRPWSQLIQRYERQPISVYLAPA
ncbi:MAG TPA: hypothetical protein VGJ86_11650 [Acidimicrobiales bacterium]|jgi:hypothetical protein